MLKKLLSYFPIFCIGIIGAIPSYYNDTRIGTAACLLVAFSAPIAQHYIVQWHHRTTERTRPFPKDKKYATTSVIKPTSIKRSRLTNWLSGGLIGNPKPSGSYTRNYVSYSRTVRISGTSRLLSTFGVGLLLQIAMLAGVYLYGNIVMLLIDAGTASEETKTESERALTDGSGIGFLSPRLLSQYADFDICVRIYLAVTLVCMIIAYVRQPYPAGGDLGSMTLGSIVAAPALLSLFAGVVMLAVMVLLVFIGWVVNSVVFVFTGDIVFFHTGAFGEFPVLRIAFLMLLVAAHVGICYAGIFSCRVIRRVVS